MFTVVILLILLATSPMLTGRIVWALYCIFKFIMLCVATFLFCYVCGFRL